MFRNYFVAALRNLTRNKLVSIINIAGLAIGFAAAILIGLYLRYQLSYESFLPGHATGVPASLTINRPDTTPQIWTAPISSSSERLKNDYRRLQMKRAPHRASYQRAARARSRIQENVLQRRCGISSDDAVSDGSRRSRHRLEAPDGLVITRAHRAPKYFGDERSDRARRSNESNEHSSTCWPDRRSARQHAFQFQDGSVGQDQNFPRTASVEKERCANASAYCYRSLHLFPAARWRAHRATSRRTLQKFLKRHYPQAAWRSQHAQHQFPLGVHLAPAGRCPLSPPTGSAHAVDTGPRRARWSSCMAVNQFRESHDGARRLSVPSKWESARAQARGAANLIAQFLGEDRAYMCSPRYRSPWRWSSFRCQRSINAEHRRGR